MASLKTLDQITGRDYSEGRAIPALADKDLDVQAEISSTEYLDLISELIRLDVPILEIGSSSIGKSYSIREMIEAYGIKGEFLFVGTEKAEFIEGIPNLKAISKRTDEIKAKSGATKDIVTEEVGEKFNYLKPYWFPNKVEIANRLNSGRRQMDNISGLIGGDTGKKISEMWEHAKAEFSGEYANINAMSVIATIKEMLLEYKKSEADIKKMKMQEKASGKKSDFTSQYLYADAMQYLSMIQGYGNFWLILDEIDKVSEQDKDKYAPLLHIVRERELKGWKLSGIRSYPEYDIKFVNSVSGRIKRLNKALDLVAEGIDIDLTDTRIIGIANDLRELEQSSPALYRRFVKIIIDKTLYIEKASGSNMSDEQVQMKNIETQLVNPAKFYENTRAAFNNCITNKEIRKDVIVGGKEVSKLSIGDDMARIDPELTGERLNELNLQWTLGFLPDILFPGQYIDPDVNPDSVPNKIIENFNNTENVFKMMFYKIIRDNFETKYIQPLMICARQLVGKKKITEAAGLNKSWSIEDAEKMLASIPDFNNPDKQVVKSQIIEQYQKLMNFVTEDYEEGAKEQRGIIQTGKGKTKDVTDTLYNSAKIKVQTGIYLIKKSIVSDKPTRLTGMLMSSIPLIQQRMLAYNLYIPFETAKQLQNDIDAAMIEVIDVLQQNTDINGNISMDMEQDFVYEYGYGIDNDLYNSIRKAGPAQTEAAVAQKQEILQKVIDNKPVLLFDLLMRKLNDTQRQLYMTHSYAIIMAEKEVMQNLLPILTYQILTSYNEGKNPQVTDELVQYATKYPYSTKAFISNVDRFEKYPELKEASGLFPRITEIADESIANNTFVWVDKANA